MQTLTRGAQAVYEVKQSKFVAVLVPWQTFDATLQALKDEHPKARHFVTAFRHLNEYGQVVEGSSDDGEPKGTSGKPSLAVLQGHDVIDTAVIVVRYFGGTKLGTGGLVRAYSQAVNDVLVAAELVPYIAMEQARFSCAYSAVGQVEHALQSCGVHQSEKYFEAERVDWTIAAGSEALECFFATVGRLVSKTDLTN